MARKLRVAVEVMNPEVVDEIFGVLRIHFAPQRVELDDSGIVYCYVVRGRKQQRVRKEIMAVLGGFDLSRDVVVRIERWAGPTRGYVPRAGEPAFPRVRVRRPLTDIRWLVEVEPESVFEWGHVRDEIARCGRPIVEEHQRTLDVPAVDEADARQLAEALEAFGEIRSTSMRRLNWFERWRRREQVFGNYSAE